MLATRFKEIMNDKNLLIGGHDSNRNKDTDKCVTMTINPLHLDEICGYADNNGFGFFYDTQAIANHTMDVDIYVQKKLDVHQSQAWHEYLFERDTNNGEPYSWFNITTNKYDHKDGLEKILGLELFSLDVEEYQAIIA